MAKKRENKRANNVARMKRQAQSAQQALIAKQAGGYAGLVQPLQQASQNSPNQPQPQQNPPQPQPQPQPQPSPVQPPTPIAPPGVASSPPAVVNARGGVGRVQYGPKKPKQVPAAVNASTKLAKAQQAYQSKADVQRRLQRQERLQALSIGQNLVSAAEAIPHQAAARLEATPTPFGLALPLLLLLLLYLMLIPVNGKSRLEWLWLTIIKDAYVTTAAIQQKSIPNPNPPDVSSSFSSFGGTGTGGNTAPPGSLVIHTDGGSYVYSGVEEW